MRYRYLLIFLIFPVFFSCKKYKGTPPPQVFPPVLLKDIVVSGLPSPFYHLEYNTANKITFASFAAGFKMYDVVFNGDKMTEMKNNTAINKDKLQYSYYNSGRINAVQYINEAGIIFKACSFTYDGKKLTNLE
ncbi:MAG: hypothetical protein ABIR18_03280 [Chitinophagaceae bacterium]